VGRAIKSVAQQSFQNWELIIIDDVSTDDTHSVLKKWADKDSRIKILRNETNVWQKEGLASNLRKGTTLAKGKYIARIDDDDYWCDSDKLRKQVEFLEKNGDYILCGGGVIVEDSSGKEIFRYLKPAEDEEIRKKALFANPFAHSSVVFLKKAADEVGGYGNWRFTEDWDLWLKLGEIGKFYNFSEYFLRYLGGEKTYSFIYQKDTSKAALEIIKRHRKDYPNFLAAYSLNLTQYLYSLLPVFIKKPLHFFLSRLKRSRF
jgi:glycosyltransferase involved in cell wall biosynthesis